jgi:ribose transport system substrate-binding protein
MIFFLTSGCQGIVNPNNEAINEGTIDSLNIEYPLPDAADILPMTEKNSDGEAFATIDDLKQMITPEDIKNVRKGKFTVAVCMHENYTQWAHVLNKGISDTLEKFNIKVLAVSDGNMDVSKMAFDMKSLSALEPDVMVVYTLSRERLSVPVQEVLDKGIKVQFFNIETKDIKYPDDYGAIINPDNFQMGYYSAKALVEKIGASGKIALLIYNTSLDQDERTIGCLTALKEYPEIEIVETVDITDNQDAAKRTEKILKDHLDIYAIWASWDQPAMAAASVAENMGKSIYVTGPDIGKESAYSLASGGAFVETASQIPYLQGIAMALNIVVELSGKTPPKYVQTPVVRVTKENLPETWALIFQEPLSQSIVDVLEQYD